MFQLIHKIRQGTSRISGICDFDGKDERLSEKALGKKKAEYFCVLSRIKNYQRL